MKLLRFVAVLLVAVLGVTVSAASSSESTSGDSTSGDSASSAPSETGKSAGDADEVDDVTLDSCGRDELGFGTATITIVNNSEKASDYSIEITFESADKSTQYGTGITFISNLGPGQTKTEDVSNLEDTPEGAVCTVSSVDRTESI